MRPSTTEEPRPGEGLRRVIMICAVVAFASAGAASMLEARMRDGSITRLAALLRVADSGLAVPARRAEPKRAELRQTTLDYVPTGSVPVSLAAPVILDPCTGERK